ncbi:MAG TPA: hypothetical protein PK156_27645 [Polyangium sp.]|nr:hypothetical protein [Polyangium sp.]
MRRIRRRGPYRSSKIRPDPHHASHTLTQFLDEWIQIGKQLGALEVEKTQLAPPDRSPATLITARNKWIRTVNLFLASAEAAEIDHNTHNILFGSLLNAESKAAKRSPKPLNAPPNQSDASSNPTPEPTQP